jgi:hypothetical protein
MNNQSTILRVSTQDLDQLQRSHFQISSLSSNALGIRAVPDHRRLLRINAVGQVQRELRYEKDEAAYRLPSEDMLIGLYGAKFPIAFLIGKTQSGTMINIGVWEPDGSGPNPSKNLEDKQKLLIASIQSSYASIESSSAADISLTPLSHVGLALGIPTAKKSDPLDVTHPMDRLIRAMSDTNWACLILAHPCDSSLVEELRNSAINDERLARSEVENVNVPNPLAEHYLDLLSIQSFNLTAGQACGMWRVAVYLLGDEGSYSRLASIWQGIFSGEDSLPEPVRVFGDSFQPDQQRLLLDLAAAWAMPGEIVTGGHGRYKHPFEYQTLLTSGQLATFIHLPRLETPGFAVHTIPEFDSETQLFSDAESVSIGTVIHRDRSTKIDYRTRLNELTRHTFVCGINGSGKTTTIQHLLRQVDNHGVPFLLIEPAKTEYRRLIYEEQFKQRLRVFTLGNDLVSPFRLNPFEFIKGIHVQTHIDLLKSVFNASFIMWGGMPYCLERAVNDIYIDKGWNLVTSENERGWHSDAFPTMTDLYRKIDSVVESMNYSELSNTELKAALKSRIHSLRLGGKGMMLDTTQSTPIDELLKHPTVLELEALGDDDEKAFLMGVIIIFLYEHYIAKGVRNDNSLVHLTIIEESHRLLSFVPPIFHSEIANMKGKAVETFSNILSEIRAYGEGIVIVEQIPSKLSLDVIKNTSLKIAHRIVAADDRHLVGGAMNMHEKHIESLGSLKVGQAVVFGEGDDLPILISVPPDEFNTSTSTSSNLRHDDDNKIMEAMQTSSNSSSQPASKKRYKSVGYQRLDTVLDNQLLDEVVNRYVMSCVVNVDALCGEIASVVRSLRGLLPARTFSNSLLNVALTRVIEDSFSRRGQQFTWPYSDTARIRDQFIGLVEEVALSRYVARKAGHELSPSELIRVVEFQTEYRRLATLPDYPFRGCVAVCPDKICLYRFTNAELVNNAKLRAMTLAGRARTGDDQELSQKLSQLYQKAATSVFSGMAPQAEIKKAIGCMVTRIYESA